MYIYEAYDNSSEYKYIVQYTSKIEKFSGSSYSFLYCATRLEVPKSLKEGLDLLMCEDCESIDIKDSFQCYCGSFHLVTVTDYYERWRYVNSI